MTVATVLFGIGMEQHVDAESCIDCDDRWLLSAEVSGEEADLISPTPLLPTVQELFGVVDDDDFVEVSGQKGGAATGAATEFASPLMAPDEFFDSHG